MIKGADLHDSVEESYRVEKARPARMVGVVEGVLGDVCVGPLQAGPDPLGRLVGELERHLEETDGKVLVDLRGQPQPEVGVDLLHVDHCLHDLLAKLQGQVAVLEQEPVTLADGVLEHLARSLLLPLSQGQLVHLLTSYLNTHK